ncbi:hypothetical protein GJ496_004090, partial [Pomphorhynchus laevis]
KQFCATISECRQKVKSVSNMLMANLLSSMKSNRAPMLIVRQSECILCRSFKASWNCELHANRQISENCQSEFDVNKDSTSELKNEKDTTENKTSKASRKRDRMFENLH